MKHVRSIAYDIGYAKLERIETFHDVRRTERDDGVAVDRDVRYRAQGAPVDRGAFRIELNFLREASARRLRGRSEPLLP